MCFVSLSSSRLNDSERMHYSIPMKVLLVGTRRRATRGIGEYYLWNTIP